ncbi:restriction endonuclease subunit S [Acinetobacter baumannii]|uniref:restriction endonuclease subunit S n=1 Tax=Acinetobacter baumannii TaxID=470 RepID=UPI002446E122|nr:restriction endonuclease subunit S [Acinetobacter baumannii]MDH2488080.1 restriction endonuclease subunit S [Acinetobacter baumannii]
MATPKLRFKEFDGNWKEAALKNCISSIDSGWSPQCESYAADLNEWGVLKTTAVDWSGFNSSFNKKLPLDLMPRKEIEVQPLDILVTRAGPTERVGVVSVVPHSVRSKLMISDKLIRLKANEQNDPSFLGISLSSVKCQNQLQSKTSGLAKSQTNISQKILVDLTLIVPSKEEQTKIATFLSAVDEKISQLTQKHELLSQYKQGMMQKLFSQQIRFKADDGSEFGEWEEKKLIDISNVITGNTPATAEKKFYDGSFLFVSPIDIQENRYVHQTKTTLTELGFEQCRIIPANSILFVCIGSTIGKVAQNKVVCATNQQINAIIPNNEYFSDYIYFQLLCHAPQIKLRAGTQAVPIINKTEFGKTILKVPCLAEQTKIANFLSSIDRKIEVVAQQIEQAKQWKKGLLQQMFV